MYTCLLLSHNFLERLHDFQSIFLQMHVFKRINNLDSCQFGSGVIHIENHIRRVALRVKLSTQA
ncbi:hypothetical protein D3C80_2237170 [compost metagenome]